MNKVFVIGDVILDKYSIGSVSRVSPEAPVPIVNLKNEKHVLGGAANVAANISSLHNPVVLFGVIGQDKAGALVEEELVNHGIENCLASSSMVFTNTKTRIIGNNQQIARIDENDRIKLTTELKNKIINSIESRISECGVLIISDYNKGVCSFDLCQALINLAREHRIIVIVDPKGNNWEKYRGAFLITPNVKELSDFCQSEVTNDDKSIESICRAISEKGLSKYLLITRSEKGMTLFSSETGSVRHYKAIAREVFDVSGAGDTVVATIGSSLNEGVSISESVKIANIAAGIVVQKVGTSTVSKEELNIQLSLSNDEGKVLLDISKAISIIERWKANGDTVVFTNGCFDIIHVGHVKLIKECSHLGDHLVIAINSDSSIKKLKGPDRPINRQEDRAFLLSCITGVDLVLIFNEETPKEILRMIKPDVLVKGSDYSIESVIGKEFAKKTVLVKLTDGFSTTRMIEKMNMCSKKTK